MQYLNFLLSNRFSVIVLWLAGFFAIFYILKWLFIKKGKALLKFLFSLLISIGEGIKNNPGISSFFGRHPVLARFLKKRFDRTVFSGLMLTVLLFLAVYTFGSFIITAVNVFVIGNVVNIDLSLANLLHSFRNPLLVKVFLWITLLGKWQVVAITTAVVGGLFWLGNKRNYIIPFFVGVGGSFFTGVIAKLVWHRPRPTEVVVYIEKSWSFPSGHAILAVSLYGFLIYFFWKYFKKWNKKIDALFLGLLVVIAIGFSRLYLGVHYLSDVWAGYLVGFFWLVISVSLVEYKNKGSLSLELEAELGSLADSDFAPEHKTKYFKVITAIALCLLAAVYVGYGLKFKPLFVYSAEEPAAQKIDTLRVREMFADHKLDKFTETLLGNPQEPFSFIIIADNDERFIKSFEQAGWFLADGVSFNSLVRTLKFEILNKAYPTAPMTPYFWQTYTHDYGFQLPTEANSARYRHHARFWRTGFTTASGQNIYGGITSLDTGVKWLGMSHRINPDIDSERELLFTDLSNAVVVSVHEKIQFVDPVLGRNFTGDQFFTDGKAYIMYLN